ncbi:FAD:protein FMN transferase [Anaerobutyricum hallii]|nr:FAD:protein FMN transferase [Anaerobutyricum hallii]
MINFRKKAVVMLLTTVFTAGMLSGCGTSGDTEKSKNDSRKAVEQTTQAEVDTDRKSQNEEDESESRDIFAMDTYMTLTAYGKNAKKALDAAVDEINNIEQLVSTGIDSSEVSQINKNGKGSVSETTGYLIKRSKEIYDSTNGVFDITIYPIMQAWGFPTENYRVPGKKELKKLRGLMGADHVLYDEKKQEVTLNKEGMKIDLGGIAKGYTSSKVMDIFKENGISSAVISLGGNVQTLNGKPDGSDWRVAVENPADTGSYIGVLSIKDKAVITSGGYERYFKQDGKTYHHIIDPANGYPANNGLTSVTIVSDDGTLADGLSTSLFIMGPEKAQKYWKGHSDEFDTILVKDDGSILVSEGLAEYFTSESDFTIIKK